MDGKTNAMISTYRQCRICGKRTTDLRKTMCDTCGGYLYVIGQNYVPKIRKGGKV